MTNFLFLIIAPGLSLTFVTNTYAVDTVINTATTSTIVLSTSGDTLTVDSTGQVTISSGNAVENNVNVIAPFINNSGLLSGGTYLFNSGIENAGTINVLTNSSTGIIYGFYGVRNLSAGTIQTLTNSNDITGTRVGIYNSFSIGELTNSGTIGNGLGGIYNEGSITTIINSGTITGSIVGIELQRGGTIGTLNNSGSITGAYAITNYGTITTLVNSHFITGSNIGIENPDNRTITNLTNSGTIRGNLFDGVENSGTINEMTNSGTISGVTNGIHNSGGTINTLTNNGSITGGTAGITNDTSYSGAFTTLNNLQGASSSGLSYVGELPTNYNIIINSSSHYGQLTVTSGTGNTTFGISSLSTTNSSILNTTLGSVLSGVASSLILNTSGTSNGYTFVLTETASGSGIWDLLITACSVCTTSDGATSDSSTTSSISNITSGTSVGLNAVGANPVLSGGTLLLLSGDNSGISFSVSSDSTIQGPASSSATLSGAFSGAGGLSFTGTGNTTMSGANTYTVGTTISSGILTVSGASPTGFGDVSVSSGATLMGTGTINGQLTVAGILKPGNSPGYLAATNTVTMNAGSTYLQDIAGTAQASSTSPVGAAGYYSFLNVTTGQFVIQHGTTLTPQLSNLFSVGQSGFGSAIFVPNLGDRFRIVTAAGGISGRFTTVTQPAELAAGTQFLPFYNMAGSNSIDLAVIPTSYQATIASASGNVNAQSVGGALTQLAQASLAGTATVTQDQLLYAISGQTSAQGIANLAQGMSGEVYAATIAVMAQTTQRTQQAVLNRLGDTAGLRLNMPMASPKAEAKSFANDNVWGELAYQRGNRASDSQSGGWGSNLYQLTFGSDFYSYKGTVAGAGFALSSTTINPTHGTSNIQQASLFAYGKMPVESFVLDAMASVGLSSSDIKRGDVTGLSAGFRKQSVLGNDVMIRLGLSRPFDAASVRLTPFARVTWQMVSQSGVNEGYAASALSVNRYTGNGIRGVIGLAAGSKANNPMTAKNTYRAYVGVGADSSGLLNPALNASLAGINTSITTPNAGTAFIQAGLYGTAKMSENSFAYAGISGEARSGQTLGTINVGLKVQF